MSDEKEIPTEEELAALRSQAELLTSISETLNRHVELHSTINESITNQSNIFQDILGTFEKINVTLTSFNSEFEKTGKILEAINNFSFDIGSDNLNKNVTENIKNVSVKIKEYEGFGITLRNTNKNFQTFQTRQQAVNGVMNNFMKSQRKKGELLQQQTSSETANIKTQVTLRQALYLWFSKTKLGILAATLASNKYFRKALNTLYVLGRVAISIAKTSFDAATQMTKSLLTLPFSIAKAGAEIGNELRLLFGEQMLQTVEDLKEKFSMSSYIGKQINIIRQGAEAAVLSFKRPNSDYVKMFGFGAEGMKKYVASFGEMVDSIGYFGEIYAGEIKNNFMMFKKMQLAAGYSAEDMKYLALDAYTSSDGLFNVMYNTFTEIRNVANQQNLDEKLLTKNVMSLRKDIILFGHISTTELANTAASITKMGVKMEDASAVFSKFSTFEEASNAAAILGQTFGMNLNAMDMLKAEKPDEIFQMFENAMLDTGRSFEDLSRFEKQIMIQQTGMSAESLKALMNYRRAGYTFEEAREKMEENDPTEIMKNSLETFKDVIKEFKKVMNSNSFFDALSKGFMQKLTYHGETRKTLMMLSKGYEGLYEYATKIDPGTITKLVRPINYIIDTMRRIFSDPAFTKGVKYILNGIGKLLSTSFSLTPEEVIQERVLRGLESTNFESIQDTKGQEHISGKIKNALEKVTDDQAKGTVLATAKSKTNFEGYKSIGLNSIIKELYNKGALNDDELIKLLKELKLPIPEVVAPKKSDAKDITAELEKGISGDAGGKGLGSLVKLTGKVAGILVKGSILGLTALLQLISKQMDKVNIDGDNTPSLASILTGISDKELDKMMSGLGEAVGGIFSKGGKLFGMGWFIVKQMTLLFKDVAFFFADIFAIAIKSAFGIKMKAKDMSFRQAAIYFNDEKEKITPDLIKQQNDVLERKIQTNFTAEDPITGKMYSREIKSSNLMRDANANKNELESILTTFVLKLNELSNIKQSTFSTEYIESLKKQFNDDPLGLKRADVKAILNFDVKKEESEQKTKVKSTQDFNGMFGLDNLHAKSQMTFMDANNNMIDLDDKSKMLGQTDGVVSVMLRMAEGVVTDLQEVSALTNEVYKTNTYVPKKDKSMLKSKITELSVRIDKSIEEMKKDETLHINPVMSKEDVLNLAKGLARNNVVKILADPQYAAGGFYLDLSTCKHTSDNEGSFSSPRLIYNT